MTSNSINNLNHHNHNQKQKNKNFNNIEIISYNQPHKRSLDDMISTDEDTRVPFTTNNNNNNNNNNNSNNQHGYSQQIRSTSSSRSNSPLLIDDIQSPAISSPPIASSPSSMTSSSSSSSLSAVFGNKFTFSTSSQQQQQPTTSSSSSSTNSLSTIQKLDTIICNLREMCKKIDKCSPSARSHVWREFADLSVRDSFGIDISDLSLPEIPLFDSRSSAKITPFLNTLINEQTPHFQALQMLNLAFVSAQQKNFNLFKEFSPQTQDDESTVPSNPYLIPQLTTSNLWGISFQSVVQQLALLDYWSPQLDALSSSSRKQLWDVCNSLPLFKSTFGSQKQEKFSKVVGLWIENPIQNMSFITTLFGAIGYLVEFKVISNTFCYPTSITKVFTSNGNSAKIEDFSSTSTTPISSGGRKKYKKYHSSATASALAALHGVDGEIPSMSPISNSSPQISFDDQSDSEDESSNSSNSTLIITNNNINNNNNNTNNNNSNNHQINGVQQINVKSSPFSTTTHRTRSISHNSILNTTDCTNNIRNITTTATPVTTTTTTTTTRTSSVESLCAVSSLDALAMTATQFEELEDQQDSSSPTIISENHPSHPNSFQSLSDPPEVPSSMVADLSDDNTRVKKRRFSCSDVKTGVMNINNIICS
ncbi:hypothetical protein DFA_05308 [Cavenderia fasciculata]|uniref:Uncharacterized protein n=1 Tax=Cavenderia fasciculata TaxID=261658 RepID=F4PNX3_CACFS|nr:uncharacterized protein DFA_05308 [Cavenderia fasciculata]EGG23176.1 hypothetical protein DFA_05308 [Cavenderia fasciculata]|eukprot:XP_004361027.1 hypothetical protein DFA_05308 [Cavenderia fasciculata]